MPSGSYLALLQEAKEKENDAISIGLKLLALAPPEDLEQLIEITKDENEHDAIYSKILMRFETEAIE